MKVKSESEVAQSCPSLSDPMDGSPPGSSVHGTLQARVLEWGAIAFSFMSLALGFSSMLFQWHPLFDWNSIQCLGFPDGSVRNQETWVLSLGQEDPLEKEMTAHSSILAWKIPWTEEPGGLQSMGSKSWT